MLVKRSSPRVLLVSPPWNPANEPSLGLAILRSALDEQGIECRVRHLNLFALEILRSRSYWALARVYALNDFLFSGVLDPEVTPGQLRILRQKCEELTSEGYVDKSRFGGIDGTIEQLLLLRSQVIPRWIDRHVEQMLAWGPSLIGFTCMFDQTIASAAIALRARARGGTSLIALGGYAVRPPTAQTVLRAFPWIDSVCVGEGEPVIGPLARASAEPGADLSSVPSLLYRAEGGQITQSRAAGLVRMDDVPVPNFDDYFADVREAEKSANVRIPVDRLPIENSRGCWWGAVHHCVFCGIHDNDLAYRQRSPHRVLSTLRELSERYGGRGFRFADYILPAEYYQTLLPDLISMGAPYELKCEIKANVDEAKMRKLAEAGFREVQPGIESFADSALTGMDKGVSSVQNVQLLLLARKHGLVIHYNLLYGFPDDDYDEYLAMVDSLPRLRHLDPPSARMRVQVTRYAPLQANPPRFGIPAARHERSYRLIFSEPYLAESGFELDDYSYMFEHPFEPAPRLARLYRRIDKICDDWKKSYMKEQCDLVYRESARGGAMVTDTRYAPQPTVTELSPAEFTVLRAISVPRTCGGLKRDLADDDAVDTDRVVARLDSLGLIFRDGNRLISLVLPQDDLAPRRHWWDNYPTRFRYLDATAPDHDRGLPPPGPGSPP